MSFSISQLFNQSKQPANIPGTQLPATGPNPNADPAVQAQQQELQQQTANAGKAASPLDEFKELWHTDKDSETPNPFAEPLFKVDATKLQEATGKMDFTKSVSPEVLQKALSGDATALQEALNKSNQAVFLQAANMMTGLIESAMKQNNGRMEQALPSKLKDYQLRNTPINNPVLQNPAVQPLVDALKFQISAKHPDMSPADVAAKAEAFMVHVSDSFQTEKTSKTEQKQKAGEMDWSSFLE